MTADRLLFSAPRTIGRRTRRERLLLLALCFVAAVRVFIFSAAFPFFNNVDESSHFDLVFKYSHGHLPAAALEKYDPEAAEIIVANRGGEYLDQQRDDSHIVVARSIAFLCDRVNPETWAWPAYYILAGAWCAFGRFLGLADGLLLYWIRFLNIPIAVALVWLARLFGRRFFPESPQKQIALPLIVAFFPQDTFYAITGDVLSPLAFAAAFYMLVQIALEQKSRSYHLLAGLAVAVTFLTKASNITILALAGVVILLKIIQTFRQHHLKQYLPALLALLVAAVTPIAFWLGRNYVLFGDPVGVAKSIEFRT